MPPATATAVQQAAHALRGRAEVTLGDFHLDAKLFPDKHPYGSGSLRAEEGSGKLQRYAKNRVLLLESGFRKSPVWGFWMLERLIKNDLYFIEKTRKKQRSEKESKQTDEKPEEKHDNLQTTAQGCSLPVNSGICAPLVRLVDLRDAVLLILH